MIERMPPHVLATPGSTPRHEAADARRVVRGVALAVAIFTAASASAQAQDTAPSTPGEGADAPVSTIAAGDTPRPAANTVATTDAAQARDVQGGAPVPPAAPATMPDSVPTTRTATAPESALSLATADGRYTLRASFWVQALARVAVGDDAGQTVDTFSLRRVRPRLEGTLFGNVDYLFMLEAGGEGKLALFDAWADVRFLPALRLRVGKQKQPFSLERLQGFPVIPLAERSFGAMVGPNRDLGVVAWGELFGGAFQYQLGLFNGVPDGRNGDDDLDDAKDVVGRVLVRPFLGVEGSPFARLALGGAASYGRATGADGETGSAALQTPSYTTPGRARMFSFRGAVTDETGRVPAVFADGARRRLEVDGYWYVGRFSLFAELVETSNTYRVPGTDTTRAVSVTAWSAMAAWLLTDDTSSYERGVEPRRPFDPAQGHWGAFELAARVQRFHVGAAAFPALANPDASVSDALNLGVCLSWCLNRHMRLQIDGERTTFRGGARGGDRSAENLALLMLTLRT
jgi:phosphate-selective porin OprO/OprP